MAMLSLRQIRRRIKSVENTKKMTRAMEMVAAAKLRKLQDLLKQSDIYIGELRRILGTLVQEKPLAHPLLENRAQVKNVLAFVISSDTGLCGSYNTNIMDRTNRFLTSDELTQPVHFVSIGKQAANYLKRTKRNIAREFTIPRPADIEQTISEVANIAKEEFQNGQADRVIFIYTKVISLGSLRPSADQLFPFVSTVPVLAGTGLVDTDSNENMSRSRTGTEPGISETNYIIEPSLPEILDIMIPEFIEAQVGQFVKHSLVAEQASRMMAMRQATDSAKDMIESLTLMRNKARQASITKELIEVVSGSRALHMK